jgi:type IV secretion system protein TrbJ
MMIARKTRHARRTATTCLSLALAMSALVTIPASAQMIVYDPTNFSQNVLTAARELQQVQNQVTALANQAQMLTNQAKNLAQLPTTTLAQVQAQAQATQSLLTYVQMLAFDVQRIEAAFSGTYGTVPSGATTTTLSTNALTRWQTSIAAFQDSLKIGAGVVGNVPGTNTSRTTLVTASQSAPGSLQALQAGNQLLALQSQQLSDLISMLAAKARADALEQARSATAEASGQQQYTLFSTRTGYVPANVTMFSGN